MLPLNKNILVEMKKHKAYTPWYTSELSKLSQVRDRIKKAAVKNQSDLLFAAYKQIRNKVTNMNQKLKRDFFSDKINAFEGNMKETWKTINQMINKRSKTTHISSLEDGDKDITDSQQIADAMNQYFCNIGEKLSSKIPTRRNPLLSGDVKINQHSKIFRFKNVDEMQICTAMKRLKKSNGFGLDGISSYFLKAGMPVLASSLSAIFNNSLRQGVFPDCWKTARIAPIFKDGPENIKSNYRPISVLPTVSRLFEKVLYGQLYQYLDENKLLYLHQSGFRSLHSCVTCLLKSTNDWYTDIDRGNVNAVVFIDLKKAFDTVDHSILLEKLSLYGIRGIELEWFRSYLSGRKQCCKVNGHISNIESIRYGVSQGSCLGPLLFLIYINDLPLALDNAKVTMYADDTSISYSSKSVDEINSAINDDLSSLKLWLEGNKLSLNVTKTQAMLIGSRAKLQNISNSDVISPKFVIDDEVVPMINEAKYLGIQIDKTLGWKEHINIIAAKISRGIGMLRYAKRYVPLSTVKTMYRSIVEPYLRYCCTVWGCCTEADLKRLQILQNRAARIVTNSAYDAHSLPLIKGLGWLTVKELIRFETATTVFKSVNQLCPDYMAQMFQRQREQAMRTLRNTETDLRLPLFRTNNGQKSFAYRGATVWNSLDHQIKLSPSLSNFKLN